MLQSGEKLLIKIKTKLDTIFRILTETKTMVVIAILETMEAKTKTIAQTMTNLQHEDSAKSMKGNMITNFTMSTEISQMYDTVCSICKVPTQYEQCCHVAMHQFKDLVMLFGANIPQQTDANIHTAIKN